MTELNGNSPGPSQGPSVNNGSAPVDFGKEMRQAQATGDFDFVLNTAKNSHRMLLDFRDVIAEARYAGKHATAIAMGLNFLENMISQSAGQISALKRAEKESEQAMKAAQHDPEKPVTPDPTSEPQPSPEAPSA